MAIMVGTPSSGAVQLKDLNVSTLFPGVILAALGTGYLYKLTASSDAVDHDEVEEVLGNSSLRWIKQRIDTSSATTKILPGTAGNVQLGNDGALADAAVSGFPTMPAVATGFDEGEATIDEGHVAVTFKLTDNKLGVYVPGTGWLWTAALVASS